MNNLLSQTRHVDQRRQLEAENKAPEEGQRLLPVAIHQVLGPDVGRNQLTGGFAQSLQGHVRVVNLLEAGHGWNTELAAQILSG